MWVEKKLKELVRMTSAPIAAGAEVGTPVAALAAPETWYTQQVLRQAGCCAGPCRQLASASLKRWGCVMQLYLDSTTLHPLTEIFQPSREAQVLNGDLT